MVGYMAGAPMAPAVATETETPTEATTLRSVFFVKSLNVGKASNIIFNYLFKGLLANLP